MSFHFASCNEMFGAADARGLAAQCRTLREAGYEGIEIAPFTLSDRPSLLSASARRECRDAITGEGMRFVGLHWLMVSSEGLHVTAPDAALRARGWERIRELVDLCADLGDGGVMVFGSPKQRGTTGGLKPAEAVEHFIEGMSGVAPHAGQRGVTILVEALPRNQCDVIVNLAEAAAVVARVNHPAVKTMFDTHNAVDETEPHAALIERYWPLIRHVHVNETDGRHPGADGYDFAAVLAVLQRLNYGGWVSVEAFDFSPGAERIARESIAHLKRQGGLA